MVKRILACLPMMVSTLVARVQKNYDKSTPPLVQFAFEFTIKIRTYHTHATTKNHITSNANVSRDTTANYVSNSVNTFQDTIVNHNIITNVNTIIRITVKTDTILNGTRTTTGTQDTTATIHIDMQNQATGVNHIIKPTINATPIIQTVGATTAANPTMLSQTAAMTAHFNVGFAPVWVIKNAIATTDRIRAMKRVP